MPRREVISVSEEAALGQVIAELVARVNQLSLKNGLPELRLRTVVSIPDELNPGGS